VQLAIASTLPGCDQDNLISLQSNIEELITLTRENLTSLQNQVKDRGLLLQAPVEEGVDHFDKEYALLKVSCKHCTLHWATWTLIVKT
jgi:hypothetical protein